MNPIVISVDMKRQYVYLKDVIDGVVVIKND